MLCSVCAVATCDVCVRAGSAAPAWLRQDVQQPRSGAWRAGVVSPFCACMVHEGDGDDVRMVPLARGATCLVERDVPASGPTGWISVGLTHAFWWSPVWIGGVRHVMY